MQASKEETAAIALELYQLCWLRAGCYCKCLEMFLWR